MDFKSLYFFIFEKIYGFITFSNFFSIFFIMVIKREEDKEDQMSSNQDISVSESENE